MAEMSARMIKEQGFANVIPQLRQFAEPLAPDFFQREKIKAGEADPAFRRLQPMLGENQADVDKGLFGIKRERMNLQAQLKEAGVNVSDQFAVTWKNFLKDFVRDMTKAINEVRDEMKRDIQRSDQMRHALGGVR